MTFLLCCMTSSGNVMDNNIENNKNIKTKKNIIEQQVKGIQTAVLNEEKIIKISPVNNKNVINPRRNSKNQDTLIDIGEFEKCQYWFYQVIKYSINDYEGYGKNKKELHDYIFKFVDFNKTLKYYNKYNKKYNNYDKGHISENSSSSIINEENIKKFCQDESNLYFIQDIRISENIYIFH